MTYRRYSKAATATTGLCLMLLSLVDAGSLVSCYVLQGAARYKLSSFVPKACDRSQCSSSDACIDCVDGGDSIATQCTDGCLYKYNNHTVQRHFFLADNIVDTVYGDLKWDFNQYSWYFSGPGGFSGPGPTTYLSLGWGTCAQTIYSLNVFFVL
jgi:hypothetical protein